MSKNTLNAAIITIMALFFVTLAQAQSGNNRAKAEDVKKETQELIKTLEQYTVEQRDQAIKEAEQALNKLDGRIAGLETQVDNNWDDMTREARETARGSLRALREQRNALAEWYGGFKNSSASAWEEMKKGFSDAYQTMSSSLQKAWSQYEADSK